MTRRNKTLLIGYALAVAGCVAIALFDRLLIGLIGAGLCTAVFAVRFLAAGSDKSDEADKMLEAANVAAPPVGAVGDNEYVVYGAPPFSYMPGNPGYRPPEGHD